MKHTLIILVLSLISTAAMALPCEEKLDHKTWSVCGTVAKTDGDETTYHVTNPSKIREDGSFAEIPFYASKNKICKELLQNEGFIAEGARASYVHGTMTTFGRALRESFLPTIASFDCKI